MVVEISISRFDARREVMRREIASFEYRGHEKRGRESRFERRARCVYIREGEGYNRRKKSARGLPIFARRCFKIAAIFRGK